jgi:hypothetical protein
MRLVAMAGKFVLEVMFGVGMIDKNMNNPFYSVTVEKN